MGELKAADASDDGGCEARQFRLVINFSSDPVDQKETAKAMQMMSRQILYQNGLDITEEVIQAVN